VRLPNCTTPETTKGLRKRGANGHPQSHAQMEIKFDLIIEDGAKPAQGVDEELPLRK
jgi:hypothetical protein